MSVNSDKIRQEIEGLRADKIAIEQERLAVEKRLRELDINWHRLSGAIIAYDKVLALLDSVPDAPTTTDQVQQNAE